MDSEQSKAKTKNGEINSLPGSNNDQLREMNVKYTKKVLVVNLIVIAISWVFLFIGFFALANLQSSLNSDNNLGTISLSAIYLALILGSAFFPKILIKFFGLKWSIVFSQAAYVIYICANAYPSWYTLIPASILLGLAASSLWVSKNLYVNEISILLKQQSEQNSEVILNRCFSFFYGVFLSAQIWANLLSSLVLKPELDVTTANNTIKDVSHCGSHGCPGSLLLPNLKKPKMKTVYMLLGILAVSAILSIIINVVFLVNIKQTQVEKRSKKEELKRLFRQFINKYQILITPFSAWIGFAHAFITADFTLYYVACVFGIPKVGYSAMFYGLSLTIGCLSFCVIVKYLGRIICACIGGLFFFSVLIFMLVWTPSSANFYISFVIVFFYGLGISFWEPNLKASIPIIFPYSTEEAFSFLMLWESAGFFIAYLVSTYTCVYVKIYILMTVSVLAIAGYLLIELLRKLKIS